MDKAYSKSIDRVTNELKTDIEKGLSSEEAAKRLAEYGPNTLGEEKKVPLWKKFLAQFADAMVIILIAAAALSAYMAYKEGTAEGWVDVIVIIAIVILNAILGVYHMWEAK